MTTVVLNSCSVLIRVLTSGFVVPKKPPASPLPLPSSPHFVYWVNFNAMHMQRNMTLKHTNLNRIIMLMIWCLLDKTTNDGRHAPSCQGGLRVKNLCKKPITPSMIITCIEHVQYVYCRCSIYRGYIWYGSAHSTTITMIKLRSDLHPRTTPHTWPLRASYGVTFVSYTKKNDRDISRTHYTWLHVCPWSVHASLDITWPFQPNKRFTFPCSVPNREYYGITDRLAYCDLLNDLEELPIIAFIAYNIQLLNAGNYWCGNYWW